MHGVVNTGQTGWHDLPIMRIDTGPSIATIPFFIGRSDRLTRTIQKNLQGDCVRGPLAVGQALMLGGVRREDPLKYYVAVCLPSTSGGWRAFIPDIPDCAVAAPSLDRAVFRAANALADHTVSLNGSAVDILPLPRDLTAIKADKQWSTAHAVDWSSAVVTLIPQRTANRLEVDHEICDAIT